MHLFHSIGIRSVCHMSTIKECSATATSAPPALSSSAAVSYTHLDYLNASQETCDTMRPPNFNNLTAFYRKPTECNYSCHVMWMGRNKLYVDFTLVDRTQPNVNGSTCLLKGAMAQIRDSTRPLGKFMTMIDLYIHDCVPGRQVSTNINNGVLH